MKTINVAIVDDGINEQATNSIGFLKHNIEIKDNLTIINRTDYDPLILNHATICSSIIKLYSPSVELSSVKILNNKNNYKATVKQLTKALVWCAENNMKIVNLSIGSSFFKDFDEIRRCINEVTKEGLIIIGAYNNNNKYTIPACLSKVIGVKSNENLHNNEYEFDILSKYGFDAMASGIHNVNSVIRGVFKTKNSNSYATPVITSQVYELLLKNPELHIEEIKKQLYKNSVNYKNDYYNPYVQISTDWIHKNIKKIDNISSVLEANIDEIIVLNSGALDSSLNYSLQELLNKLAYNTKYLIYFSDKKLLDNEIVGLMEQEKIKIWNNEIYENYMKYVLNKDFVELKIEVPTVVFYGLVNEEILRDIKDLFNKDGYHAILISDKYVDILHGYEYMPPSINNKKFLSYIVEKFDCDIIIYNNTKSFLKYNELFEFDVHIVPSNLDCFGLEEEKHLEGEFIYIEINRNNMGKGSKKIYKKIKKILV